MDTVRVARNATRPTYNLWISVRGSMIIFTTVLLLQFTAGTLLLSYSLILTIILILVHLLDLLVTHAYHLPFLCNRPHGNLYAELSHQYSRCNNLDNNTLERCKSHCPN